MVIIDMAGDDQSRLAAMIQDWLDARVPERLHGYIWFVLLAFAGLGVTAALAYGIRLILGIG